MKKIRMWRYEVVIFQNSNTADCGLVYDKKIFWLNEYDENRTMQIVSNHLFKHNITYHAFIVERVTSAKEAKNDT